jgi:hypothetical protein
MTPDDPQEIFERAIASLASSAEDALSKAEAEGLPDREEVVDWVERCKRLVLVERDRSAKFHPPQPNPKSAKSAKSAVKKQSQTCTTPKPPLLWPVSRPRHPVF